ncbi:putative fatty acyl-CoA reductase CG5065 [Apis cerana]|uniref:Fatty acyl-CoA reductase n=2 Tax=Apis cerana TaxID=7461 RepID=A0A2A3EL05_APICC|nr:putative fatty acyl-CoA reductase CG5065 [Apis cerana]XP_016914025.1 putative fatty acyl-CoA reductase CG5065 [Apis cerana]XP_016914026.1 putative fatty acyl-CoA reductase CG5065 [Apis cerana]XP_028523042.1 putative fatty acyl-CoA reductase CG5065 [Apis cerana]XP_061938880.1 putative fatty acyl-CoA reductase CG5065 [Apis cerana]XP_061938881.1 putative fatty acyl-CoA reductase CG5065 [Apis cerana]PBC32174.1 Putative fatty acyl-CoA reductase [Apis cerana cerana]
MSTISDNQCTSVRDFYKDRSIFITGGTGFMGKVLVEKLLRSCPGIKNIYILMRPKKSQDIQQRLQKLLDVPLFDKLRRDAPDELLKIIPIAGDVTEHELGISEADQNVIIRDVSIVFHSAATVKFDEPLKRSVHINMIGTKQLLNLCHRMHNLEALIHVSTAYCNCDRHDVAEEIYPVSAEPEEIMALTKLMDSQMIDNITPTLIGNRPNTYTFTKALTERMLQSECGHLPIAIVRPSIVLSSFREPVSGWVDNLNGPTGIVAAAGKGFFRSMLCQKNMVADLVPVDIVINLMICTAWRTATNRTKTIPIYHCCTGQQNPITWQQFVELILKYNRMHPPNDTIWWPDGKCHTFAIVNNVCKLFQHLLPAHILDFILRLRGKPAIMVGLHEKIDKAVKCLEYFTMQQWTFRDDNVRQLSGELSPEDRQIFMFDVKQIDWPSYLEQYILGIRQFIIKDSPETLPAARSHIKKLYWIQKVVEFGMILVVLRFLLLRIPMAQSACFTLLSAILRMCRMIV